MTPLKRITFVVNSSKAGARVLADELAEQTRKCGGDAVITEEHPLPKGFLEGRDACCVLGGDGTLLATAAEAIRCDVPVFGVNRGKLGFLATFSAEEALQRLQGILRGDYDIMTRTVLGAEMDCGTSAIALNDVVIKQTDATGLILLRVESDGELVTHYSCDGLIFATPTGSTAYNLSAGGPIVYPSARVICMTPICPHTLTNRSLIFPERKRLTVSCEGEVTCPLITVDGTYHFEGHSCLPIEVAIAEKSLKLLQPLNYNHFRILRQKLQWGGD
ncbi:MAG: NAD(+)/NADH kinase [Opitutales bacterium]